MLTVSEAERDLLDAVAAGRGRLPGEVDPARRAARRAAGAPPHGEPVFSPALAALVLGEFRRHGEAGTGPVQPAVATASARCCSTSPAATPTARSASELFISPKTVENHVRNILGKLHLNRKQELIRYAVEHGIE